MKAGAYDYLAKPYEIDELRLVVTRAMERQQLREEVRGLREYLAAEGQFGNMVGSSAAMREVRFRQAERVAQGDLPDYNSRRERHRQRPHRTGTTREEPALPRPSGGTQLRRAAGNACRKRVIR